MESHFSAEFFKGNRAKLRTLFTGTAPIVVTGNGLLQRGGDAAFPFHQDSNFWYLTGIDEPDITLVLDKEKEYLIVPEREETREAFDGSISDDTLKQRSGISTIYDQKTGWRQLESRLKRVKHVATLAAPQPYISHYGMYTNPSRAELIKKIQEINPTAELLDLREHFVRLRMIKQPEELAAIKHAIAITSATLKEVMRKRKAYGHEYELEAAITKGFRCRGAGHAYTPIVASGKHACTLHYVANGEALLPNELVLIDVGAEVEHYAADITRTYCLKPPTKRERAVYDAVKDVQEFAKQHLGPGVILKEYETAVSLFLGEKLRELGLVKTISEETIRKYYPHSTSHFLGLDVHDAGDYSRPLEPGVVLTVEPGIYIPEENIGVRIEDDVLVTQKGIMVLSKQLPQEL